MESKASIFAKLGFLINFALKSPLTLILTSLFGALPCLGLITFFHKHSEKVKISKNPVVFSLVLYFIISKFGLCEALEDDIMLGQIQMNHGDGWLVAFMSVLIGFVISLVGFVVLLLIGKLFRSGSRPAAS